MCGRYALRQAGIDILADHFFVRAPRHPDLLTLLPRYNAAPMQTHPVVAVNREGVRALQPMRWGFVPSWSKEKPKVRPINARDDTVATGGLFRSAFKKHRCLVPADGYYEWRDDGGPKKQPYLFEVGGGDLFAFAGIWDPWRETPDADPVLGFATLTTTPNAVARQVHDRMPVILPEGLWEQWLDPAFQDVEALQAMLRPLPDNILAYRPVKFEGPACIEPPPPVSTAVASDQPLGLGKKARKPRVKLGSTPDIDLFTTNGRRLAR